MSPWLAMVGAGAGAFVITSWWRGICRLILGGKPVPQVLKALMALSVAVALTFLLLPSASGRVITAVSLGADGLAWVTYELTSCLQATKDRRRQEIVHTPRR